MQISVALNLELVYALKISKADSFLNKMKLHFRAKSPINYM